MLNSTSSKVLTMWPDSRPSQMAGSAWRLIRSLIEPCSRLISSLPSFGSLATSIRRRLQSIAHAAFAQLLQELLRRNEEGIDLQHAAEDHHRMSPQDAHDNVPAEPGEVVGADDRVAAALVHQVELRLVFHQVTHAFVILQRPLHVGDQTGARKTALPGGHEHVPP